MGRGWVWVLGGAVALLSGCELESHQCDLSLLLGPPFKVTLVDAAGKPALAKGQLLYATHDAVEFDCAHPSPNSGLEGSCDDGAVVLGFTIFDRDDNTVRIRFEDPSGSLTDWQVLPIAIDGKLVKDAHGKGCDQTIFEGTIAPVTVPAEVLAPSDNAEGGAGAGGAAGASSTG